MIFSVVINTRPMNVYGDDRRREGMYYAGGEPAGYTEI